MNTEFYCPACNELLRPMLGEYWCDKCRKTFPVDEQEQEKERQEKERFFKLEASRRLELLQKLHASVEANEGDLSGLSYVEIKALVENMQEFPDLADSLIPEEYAVREKLYKVAFFNRNSQAGLHAILQAQYAKEQAREATVQTELLNKLNIAVGNKPSGSAAKGSKAAMLGGAAALMKLNQISQDVNEINEDVSEGFGGF
jgi:hypothetical protein